MSVMALAGLADGVASAFVTLLVLIDPIGLLPIFIALTAGFEAQARRRIARNAVLIAGGVLCVFGLSGEAVLAGIGVGMPAFRIAGGLMLFLIALEMLFERRTARRSKAATEMAGERADDEPEADPTVFPLATPLLAGPGALAGMVLLTGAAETAAEHAAIYLSLAGVLGVSFLLFLAADPVENALGPTGVKLVTRLLGVLLGALAVQFVLDGLAASALFAP